MLNFDIYMNFQFQKSFYEKHSFFLNYNSDHHDT
jgi:hypothetical protein